MKFNGYCRVLGVLGALAVAGCGGGGQLEDIGESQQALLTNSNWAATPAFVFPMQGTQPLVLSKRHNDSNTYTWVIARNDNASPTAQLVRSTRQMAGFSAWSSLANATGVFSGPGGTSWQGTSADTNRNVLIAYIMGDSVSNSVRIGHSSSSDATNLTWSTISSSSGNSFERPAVAWSSTTNRLFVFTTTPAGVIRYKWISAGTTGNVTGGGWSAWNTVAGMTLGGGIAAASIAGDMITLMGIGSACTPGPCHAVMLRFKPSILAPDPGSPNWLTVPGGAVFSPGTTLFLQSSGIGGGGSGARVVARHASGALSSATSPSFNNWDTLNATGCGAFNDPTWSPIRNNGNSMFLNTCSSALPIFSTM